MISSPGFSPPAAARPAVPPTVSTQWLCDHLGSDTMVVLDARGFARPDDPSETRCTRVPTAHFAGAFSLYASPAGVTPVPAPGSPGVPGPAVSEPAFDALALRFGIDADTTVVVYDGGAGSTTADVGDDAARLRDVLLAHGYERVSVLNGGFSKWTAEDRPVDSAADSAAA